MEHFNAIDCFRMNPSRKLSTETLIYVTSHTVAFACPNWSHCNTNAMKHISQYIVHKYSILSIFLIHLQKKKIIY